MRPDHDRSPAALAAAATLLCVFLPLAAPAGPPPGSAVQGPAARAVVEGLQTGGPRMATVGDPEKAARLGLPGLQSGDAVEVSHQGGDTWLIRDPKTGRTATTRTEPDLGGK